MAQMTAAVTEQQVKEFMHNVTILTCTLLSVQLNLKTLRLTEEMYCE
jgi:hypothetical protein